MSPSPQQGQLDRIEEKLDQTLDWINGTNESEGAKVRIARLEDKEESRTFWSRAAFGGAASSLVVAVAGFFWNKR